MTTKTLLVCGAIAGRLFVTLFLVEGAVRPEYNPLRHPVSSLALGDLGWVQTVNFLVAGLLMLAFAVGLRRALRPLEGSTWGSLLVGASAIGLLGAGVFVADPIDGYPPGALDRSLHSSLHGVLHDPFSALVFLGPPAAGLVFGRWFAARGERSWAISSAASAAVFVGALASPARALHRPRAWWSSPGWSSALRSSPASAG